MARVSIVEPLKQELIVELARTNLFSAIDLHQLEFTEFSEGKNNRVYHISDDGLIDHVVRFSDMGKKRKDYYREEFQNIAIAAKNGLAIKPVYVCEETGLMIYPYLSGRTLMPKECLPGGYLFQIMGLLNRLHAIEETFSYEHDFLKSIQKRIGKTRKISPLLSQQEQLLKHIFVVIQILLKHPVKAVPCHSDLVLENFVKSGEIIYMIDWQFSGMGDPHEELANFFYCADLPLGIWGSAMEAYMKGGDMLAKSRVWLFGVLVPFNWLMRYEIAVQQEPEANKSRLRSKQIKRLQLIQSIIDHDEYRAAMDFLQS